MSHSCDQADKIVYAKCLVLLGHQPCDTLTNCDELFCVALRRTETSYLFVKTRGVTQQEVSEEQELLEYQHASRFPVCLWCV